MQTIQPQQIKELEKKFPGRRFNLTFEREIIHIHFDAYFPDKKVDELHRVAIGLFGSSNFILERMPF